MKELELLPAFYSGHGTRTTKAVVIRVTKSGCYEVISHRPGVSGYPRIRIDGVLWTLNRYIYTRLLGPIPEHMLVCHRCDNRLCVNPEHLFIGSIADNNKDMRDKGRSYRPGARKLSIADVQAIRKARDMKVEELAKQYHVSQRTIRSIWYKETWKNV
jgi:hypothetical protein